MTDRSHARRSLEHGFLILLVIVALLQHFNGFVIGPVIAALFMAVWDIFADTPDATATEPTA